MASIPDMPMAIPPVGLSIPEAKKSPASRGANCAACPLARKPLADTENLGKDIAIVSRSPGTWDTNDGKPFAGPSGKVVNHLLKMYGYQRSDVTLTNVVLCKTEKPSRAAIECCAPRLRNDLADAKVIIAGGVEAVQSQLHMPLEKARGNRHMGLNGKKIIATYNPAMALRDDTKFPSLMQDFRRAFTDAPEFKPPTIEWTEDYVTAYRWLNKLGSTERLAIDIETTGLSATSDLVSIGFGDSDSHGYVIGRRVCGSPEGKDALRAWFSGYKGKCIWQNGKFDVKVLRHSQIPAHVDEDTLLLSFITDERPGVHSLDYQLQNELDWPYYEPPAVTAGKKNGFKLDHEGKPFTQWAELYEYNGYDCCGSFALYHLLMERALEQETVLRRYYDLLIPGSTVFADVERRGISFDKDEALRISSEEVRPRLLSLSELAGQIIGQPINLNSSQQCGRWLYDVKGIRDPKLNKEQSRSVDEKHRDYIREHATDEQVVAFVDKLHEFKKLDKLRGTYLDGLVRRVDGDGRLRCDLLLHGTETGRLSSRRPNLQNQPRTSDADIERGEGYVNIRKLYYAASGRSLIQADYSQVELRTAAVLAQDEFLMTVYAEGKDLHDEMAAFLFGTNFTKQQRVAAKAANFGALFGIEAWYFSQLFGMSQFEAQRILDRWWNRVPQIAEWCAVQRNLARTEGFVETAFGHRRRFYLITDQNKKEVDRSAVNTPVQGTASDFTTHSIIELHNERDRSVGVVLAVHDSLLAEYRSADVHGKSGEIREVMEAIPKLKLGWDDIPFTVDIQIGQRWGSM